MVLSTKVNPQGETEKRFATPFGTIDVTLRNLSSEKTLLPPFQIEVRGDTDNWIFCDSAMADFKTALLHFIWGIAQDHFTGGHGGGIDDLCVSVHIKGAEVRLMLPCEHSTKTQGKACTLRNNL